MQGGIVMSALVELRKEETERKLGGGCEEVGTPALDRLVECSIRTQTGGLIRGLEVEAVGDRLIIRGVADLFYHKQLATRAAMDVCEGVTLQNEIGVCHS